MDRWPHHNQHQGHGGGSGGGGGGNAHSNADPPSQAQSQSQSQSQPRPGAAFGPGTPQHPPHQSPPSGPSGLPPPAPFAQFHQAPHSLASLAGLSQSSPRQPPPPPSQRPDDRGPPPPQGPGFGLPSLSQATGQPSVAERERERAREVEQIHIKEEEDRRHREEITRRLEQPQHQAHVGPPVHIHQPVAVGPRNAIHGPNGLLGNPGLAGPGPQPQPHHPLGAPAGPANVFAGGPVQASQPPSAQQMQASLLTPYGSAPQPSQPPPQQMAQGQQQQGQGQQPILNDALSYLDQVKVQFADHPDVYNRFLDIMKDFKSGAIDTPGVIGRVSHLFAGNPELIQGFNTFLPPGYRIEVTGDDPNSIRVTTPMGTTVSAMPEPLTRQELLDGARPTNGTFTPQPKHNAQLVYSPSGRAIGPVTSGHQHLSPLDNARQQEVMHAQQERGVTSLQSAVSAASGIAGLRAGVSPRATPMPGQPDGAPGGDANMEKRGPVEFNHAISYVNKIKNRFASQPDIYKQFLEILQTYQRESKPIQDVYGQVTTLFKTAPDLLEDFKQFLPESAAQAKAAEKARQEAEILNTSNIRGDGGGLYNSPVVSRETQMGTPGQPRGALPPVGNFAVTPASKDNAKRKRGGTAGLPDALAGPSGTKAQFPGAPASKRPKHAHGHATVSRQHEQPPSSPTLIPSLPVPLEPTTTSAATSDELSFFDKAKKAISNKNVFNEFLKLCNLFSQDLIDRSMLLFRARSFIGGNQELMKWFEDWVGLDERDIVIENKPRVPSGRVMLSNCRGLGPSYRLLPKRERQKPCSGRDELCNSVLNDEWASHPTWASEDSGFIAHRKNVHEEGLHRIEEERHDYDFNIEAAARTVQLLEPIATQLRRLDDLSQRNYQLPPGLGGQSETIYKRIIMKLYGRDKGGEVIASLHDRPFQVIPVLLNRIKERLESWKMGQREWEKVWRDQTQKMFWKSLDHQAAQAKTTDRRAFQSKTLTQEISTRYEEMKRAANANPSVIKNPQLELTIEDPDVLLDATLLVLRHVAVAFETDHPKLTEFIRDFVPLFFGLNAAKFHVDLETKLGGTADRAYGGDSPSGGDDTASVNSRQGGGRGDGLLKVALDPSRSKKLKKDGASPSRASTPDVASNADPDEKSVEKTLENAADTSAEPAVATTEGDPQAELSNKRWLDHPLTKNNFDGKNVNPLEAETRHSYRMWANNNMFCFVRLFIMLYERLHKLKQAEPQVRRAIHDAKLVIPAVQLGIIDKVPRDYFSDVSESANYYSQMMSKFEEVLYGNIEFTEVEETLRRFYLQSGYPLYPFEKLVNTIAKDAIAVMNSDNKDKSADLYALFKKDRVKDTFTAQQLTDYRKAAEKMIKDNEYYRIDYDTRHNNVKMFVSRRDDPIAEDGLTDMDREARWRHYISEFSGLEPTGGVNMSEARPVYLKKNVRAFGPHGEAEDTDSLPSANAAFELKSEENLGLRIAVGSYKAVFSTDSHEYWHRALSNREGAQNGVELSEDSRAHRDERANVRLLIENDAIKGLPMEEVEKRNKNFASQAEKGVDAEPDRTDETKDEDKPIETDDVEMD